MWWWRFCRLLQCQLEVVLRPLPKCWSFPFHELASSGPFAGSSSSKHEAGPSWGSRAWVDEPREWLGYRRDSWLDRWAREVVVGFLPGGWLQADPRGSVVGPGSFNVFISDLEEETEAHLSNLWTPSWRCSWPPQGPLDLALVCVWNSAQLWAACPVPCW